MRLFLLTTFGIFLLAFFAEGQTIQLKTQAQVNAMAGGSTIIHSLQIGSALDSELSDINDLSPLSGITTLYGAGLAIVNNPHLKNLHGLENIHHINGSIIILNNDSLPNLSGLPDTYSLGDTPDEYKIISTQGNGLLTSFEGIPLADGLFSITSYFNDQIEDLSALNKYSKLLGGFVLYGGNATSLSGLDSLTSIGGISLENTLIADFSNLEKLRHLQLLYLRDNINFTGFGGLEHIHSLQEIQMDNCDATINFLGLDSLKTIKKLIITKCDGLVSLQGLDALDTLRNLFINNCQSIKSLHGLENLQSLESMEIKENPQLQSIDEVGDPIAILDIEHCDNLLHINRVQSPGVTTITYNKRLKNYGSSQSISLPHTATNIEITHNDSLTSVVGLLGLSRVESTSSTSGRLILVHNPLLSSIKGLDSLHFIGKNFYFGWTPVTDLLPLHLLDTVGGSFSMGTDRLKSLNGLENLKYIGYSTGISGDSLTDIEAFANNLLFVKNYFAINNLEKLSEINGFHNLNQSGDALNRFQILNNPNLESISGFDKIDTATSNGLYIENNPKLSQFIAFNNFKYCTDFYLINTPSLTNISGLCPLFTEGTIDGTIEIHDNAPGFNSVQEIIDWCMTPTEDLPTYDAISVYPNPTSDAFQIEVPLDLIQVGMMVDLVDISGTSHFSARLHDTVSRIPVSDLPPGLYFLRIVFDGRMVQVKKVVVEK